MARSCDAKFCCIPNVCDHSSEPATEAIDTDHAEGLVEVTLKVYSNFDPTPSYTATVCVPPRSSVYTLLLQAAADDSNFTFQATYDDEFSSHLITSINNVAASEANKTYWSFENKSGQEFDRGVDLIGVFNGDVMVFNLKGYGSESDRSNRKETRKTKQ